GGVDSASNTVPLAKGSGLAASSLLALPPGDDYFVIQVDSEQMAVTALALNADGTATLTVVRGYNGTSAASHTNPTEPVAPASDQRGCVRPAGTAPDIGAFQTTPLSLVVPPVTAVQGAPITPATFSGGGGASGPYTFSATGLPAGLSLSSGGTL